MQLPNVFQTFGVQLATAEALVVLATIHPRVYGVYGKMKGCARMYGGYRYCAVPFIRPCIMVLDMAGIDTVRYRLSAHASWY